MISDFRLLIKLSIYILFFTILTSCSNTVDHLSDGVDLFRKGLYERAALEFNNILKDEPSHADARYWLGCTFEKRENKKLAYQQFKHVIENNPDHIKSRIKLAEIYVHYAMSNEAVDQLEEIKKLDPDNKSLKLLWGKVYYINNQIDKAYTLAKSVYENEKVKSPESTLFLADILDQKNKLDESITTLKKGLADNPSDIELMLRLAGTLMNRGERREADIHIQKIKSSPFLRPSYSIKLAQLYYYSGDSDESKVVLRNAINKFNNVDTKMALVELLIETDDYSGALKQAKVFLNENPEAHDLRIMLANLYKETNDIEAAEKEYKYIIDIAKFNENKVEAQLKLAELLITDNRESEAEDLLDDVIKESPKNHQAYLSRGRLYLNRGVYLLALSDVKKVLKDDPDSFLALKLLADIHVQNKNIPLAIDVLKQALESNSSAFNVRLELAELYKKYNHIDEAIKTLKSAENDPKSQSTILRALLDLQITTEDWESAVATIRNYKKLKSDRFTTYLLSGYLCQEMGDIEAARLEFQHALALKPAAREPLEKIVADYIDNDMGFLAADLTRDYIDRYPDAFFAYHLLGLAEWSEDEISIAEVAFRKAIELQSKWSEPYISLGNMFIQIGEAEKAFDVYQLGLQESTDSTALLLQISQSYEDIGEYDQAINSYEILLDKNPGFKIGINNLAQLLVSYKGDKSLKRALDIVVPLKYAKELEYRDTYAWVLYKNNQVDEAISVLIDVVEADPENARYQYHMGMAFNKKGYTKLAKKHLKNAIDANSDFTEIESARAAYSKL